MPAAFIWTHCRQLRAHHQDHQSNNIRRRKEQQVRTETTARVRRLKRGRDAIMAHVCRRLENPIPCPGALSLWDFPDSQLGALK